MADYIRARIIQSGFINNVSQLKGFGKTIWNFISFIYKSSWNTINTNNNISFRNRIFSKFTPKVPKTKTLSNSSSFKNKAVKIVKLPPSIPAYLSKKILEKSKFFGKGKKLVTMDKAP